MRKAILLFALIISFISCEDKNDFLHLSITNQTSNDITDLKLYTYVGGGEGKLIFQDSLFIGAISKGQKLEKYWDLKNLVKSDGSYYLVFTNNKNVLDKTFGYFSNGILINEKYSILISDYEIVVTQ
jgi:predicted AlkP superfamily phosphohydrolase/phosphomutase